MAAWSYAVAAATPRLAGVPRATAAESINTVASESDTALTEIVITAQRRSEIAQDVPISVSVYSADDLKVVGAALSDEDFPHHCHRRLVAEYLKAKWQNVEICHL